MEKTEQLQSAQAAISRLRACGHFLYHRTGGKTGRRRILRILSAQPDILQKELQEKLRIQPGSMSEVVIRLEADGLVQKHRSEADGRQWALHLTEKGHAEALRLNAEHDAQIQEMMSCFTQEQIDSLIVELDALLAHWDTLDFPTACTEKEMG